MCVLPRRVRGSCHPATSLGGPRQLCPAGDRRGRGYPVTARARAAIVAPACRAEAKVWCATRCAARAGAGQTRWPDRAAHPGAGTSPPPRNSPTYSKHRKLTRRISLMRSILATPAARILRVSRIHHGNGTLMHYRGLRDDAGCASIAAAAAHTTLRHPDPLGRVRGTHGPKGGVGRARDQSEGASSAGSSASSDASGPGSSSGLRSAPPSALDCLAFARLTYSST
jgi:hypothetical protein